MNKDFIITGAAQGLGLEFARRVLSGRGRVVLTDIAVEVGEQAKDKLEEEFGKDRVVFIQLDVRDEQRWRQVWDQAEEFFQGKVEALINNAGLFNKNWKLMSDINFGGTLTGTMLALEKMGVSHGGSGGLVVQTASLAAILGVGFASVEEEVYTATKWAILGLTRSFASENIYQRDQVRMVTICPSAVDTTLVRHAMETYATEEERRTKTWMGVRVMEPTEIGDALERLVEDGASGQAMTVGPGISYYWPDHNKTLFIIMKILHTLWISLGRHPPSQPVSTNQMAFAAGAVMFFFGIIFHLFLKYLGL